MIRKPLTLLALAIPLLMQAQLAVPWAPLGGGTDQQVRTLLRLSNGDLLVAGQFEQAGFVPCSHVARWDGAAYSAMPGFPVQFEVSCVAELNDTIYVGGRSTASGVYHDLMKWDGSTWTGESVFPGLLPGILDLFAHDGTLYASGRISGALTMRSCIKRHTGTEWECIGQPLNGEIMSIAYFAGHLVCGGSFTGSFGSAANDIQYVAFLDLNNTWYQMGDGLGSTVHDLLAEGGALYAAGDCVGQGLTHFGLARLSLDVINTEWEHLMPNIADYMAPLNGDRVSIFDMVAHEGRVYLGGDFYCSGPDGPGRGVAVFNGEPDDVEPYCAFGGPVYAVEITGTHNLVAAGSGNSYRNIAVVDITTDITDGTVKQFFTLSPNPSSGRATIQLGGTLVNWIHISDINGRLVREVRTSQWQDVLIDLSGEPQGTYIIEVGSEGTVHRERLVLMR